MGARRIFLWGAIASAVVAAVGGFGPWASVLDVVSVHGTDGDAGGWWVIGAAIVAVMLLVLQDRKHMGAAPALVALLAALIASTVAISNWVDLRRTTDELGFIESEWGIYLATIGSVALVAACIALVVTSPPTGIPGPAPPQGGS